MKTFKKTFINLLLKKGGKHTGEKIFRKVAKSIQKNHKKSFLSIIKLSIINSSGAFKVDKHVSKKGKRKSTRTVPVFLVSKKSREIEAIKTMLSLARQKKIDSKKIVFKVTEEIISTAKLTSNSISIREELYKEALLQKKYISKFKW